MGITFNVRKYGQQVAFYILIIVVVIVSLFPLYWMVATSLKRNVDTFAIPPLWLFEPVLSAYRTVLRRANFLRYFYNSMVIGFGNTLLALGVSVPAAYSLARMRFAGRKSILLSILSLRMVPPITLIIPLFLVLKTYHLLDTHLGLMFAHAVTQVPLAVWLMMGYLAEVPREIEDAALVDGCNRLSTLWRVVLPVVAPGLAVLAILLFIGSWNEFLMAMLLSRNVAKTLPVGLGEFVGEQSMPFDLLAAAGTLVIIPVLLLTLGVQKYLVKGLTLGAVK